MIREIVKDLDFLSQKSLPFDFINDKDVIADLLDTANSFGLRCAGLASIQIGRPVRAVVVRSSETSFMVLINPTIFSRKDPYTSTEGCLSLEGERQVTRYRTIKVSYYNSAGKMVLKEFRGFLAKAIQHEVDHLNGVLI